MSPNEWAKEHGVEKTTKLKKKKEGEQEDGKWRDKKGRGGQAEGAVCRRTSGRQREMDRWIEGAKEGGLMRMQNLLKCFLRLLCVRLMS